MDFEKIISELQGRLEELEGKLRGTEVEVIREPDNPRDRADYVERGSAGHAAILGLERAEDTDDHTLDGWRLADRFSFGFNEDYQGEVLRQRVSDLTSEMPKLQSDSRRDPFYAPKMWRAPKRQLR